ncbi:hypothetical protein BKA00_005072 [Actinomadura coerulea]|uniref:Uncharacterized protein n=1 Tax=Actinomadura coerulea TaxID=46159 RepID=A0A7X0G2D8_9ACTN|nr:hypothetical protein [Actinomadura coerulea]
MPATPAARRWFEGGYVTGAYHVRDPEKLSRVEQETTLSR